MAQGELFPTLAGLGPTDPNVRPADVPRLSRQVRAVVERLRRGPATNDELSRIARKYTSRVSDARQHGHDIRCFRRENNGLTWYGLFVNGEMCRDD